WPDSETGGEIVSWHPEFLLTCRSRSKPSGSAKARPGGMTYGSGGRGDATHLAAERFRLAAGLEGLYVPFRGASEVLTEVMAGRLDFYMAPISPAMPLLAGRQLQALAVAAATRASALPEIPTTTEIGRHTSE